MSMERNRFDAAQAPEPIAAHVAGLPYSENTVGLSGARVLVFDDYVLKIGRQRPQDEGTVSVMRWLEGRLPVPRVVACAAEEGVRYLLMTRLGGRMACDPGYLQNPRELTALLAQAIRRLWRVDIAGCPRLCDPAAELAEARERVEHGLVDVERAEPETFGPGGFEGPAALLAWLEAHRPACDPVFSHGDLCLPNIFLDGGQVCGYIDLDAAGVGDRWRDIALCLRSLRHNLNGEYGGRAYGGFDAQRLFDALGVAPDWEKIRYYTLLDELF